MINTKCLRTTSLALLGTAFLVTSLRAQTTTNYAAGDLLLGFRQTAGTNTSNDLLTDLGAVTTFSNLQLSNPGAVINVNTGNFISGGSGASGINGIGGLGADLQSLWGSNWSSVTDNSQTSWNFGNQSVLFGAVGTNGSTVYVGNTSATPYSPSSSGSQNGVKARVDQVGGQSYDFNTSTANSNFNTLESGSSTSTWQGNTFRVNNNANNFTLYPTAFEAAQGTTLYLDREVAGSANGIELGFFSLDSAGDLTFTVAAVPEPATWASAILVVLALVGVTAKRRFNTAKA